MKEYKIVVAGNGGVGKSALTVQFVQGFFVQNYDATIEDSYRKQVEIDDQLCRLEILDTAGTEQFSGMRDLYIKNGQGFVLVYAVNDANSFRDLVPMRDMIYRIKNAKQAPIVIVGNKCDLINERVISREDGLNLAKQYECCFVESSAKTNQNVNEIFHSIVKQINRQQSQSTKKSGRKERKQKEEVIDGKTTIDRGAQSIKAVCSCVLL